MRFVTTVLMMLALGLVPIIGGTWVLNSVLVALGAPGGLVTVVAVVGFVAAAVWTIVTIMNALIAALSIGA